MNSSLVSGGSRDSKFFKSKSQARTRRGYGRILQNNVGEVQSYLQDGGLHYNDQKSKMSYSRFEVAAHGKSKDSIGRDRNQNISRMLGKQQSEARMIALQMAKGAYRDVDQRGGNNSLSQSILRGGRYNTQGGGKDALQEDSIVSRADRVNDVEGSFSYLPSIAGMYQSKANDSGSVEISSRKKSFGPHSLTGKKPLLIANYRRAQHLGPGF